MHDIMVPSHENLVCIIGLSVRRNYCSCDVRSHNAVNLSKIVMFLCCFCCCYSLKRKCCHFDEILITDCTESCHFDNFRCNQWWKFRQNDDISLFQCCAAKQPSSSVNWLAKLDESQKSQRGRCRWPGAYLVPSYIQTSWWRRPFGMFHECPEPTALA